MPHVIWLSVAQEPSPLLSVEYSSETVQFNSSVLQICVPSYSLLLLIILVLPPSFYY